MKKSFISIVLILLAFTSVSAEVGFQFGTYGRAGVLFNQAGNQVDPNTKNVNRVGRLGNEPDIYYEAILKGLLNGDSVESTWLIMLAPSGIDPSKPVSTQLNDGDGSAIAVRQVAAEITGMPFAPNQLWWAGKKYYKRWNVHITDLYPRDYSGTGGGVDGLFAGILDIAYIAGTPESALTDLGSGGLMSHNIVAEGHFGGLDVDLVVKFAPGNAEISAAPAPGDAEFGINGGVTYNFDGFFGAPGLAKLAVQGGYGLGANNGLGKTQWYWSTMENEWSVRIVLDSVWEGEKVDVAVAAYSQFDDFTSNMSDNSLTSLVSRQVLKYGHFLLQFEEGGSYQAFINDSSASGFEYKLTIAPTLTFDSKYFGRPQLRLFGSIVGWTGGRKPTTASVANDSYEFRFGIQAETWF